MCRCAGAGVVSGVGGVLKIFSASSTGETMPDAGRFLKPCNDGRLLPKWRPLLDMAATKQ